MDIKTFSDSIRTKQAILSFSGWPDAGMLVQHTLTEVRNSLPCEPAAEWDMDGYWDTDSSRPQVLVHHGQIQRVEWPTYHFSLCKGSTPTPRILIGSGPEPRIRWRAFTNQLLHLLKHWGCEEIILLGSFYDEVFHDEILISGLVHDSQGFNRIREAGCQFTEYDGPAAIHSAIMESAQNLDLHCLAVWAHFPFYLNAQHELLMANMLRIVGSFINVEFETDYLEAAWQKREQEIAELIEQDDELKEVLETIKREDHSQQKPQHGPSNVIRFDEFLKRRNRFTPPPE